MRNAGIPVNRRVRQVSGRTALKWITESVINDIRRYLSYPELSIKEITDRMMFPNLSFFGKYVKQYLGCHLQNTAVQKAQHVTNRHTSLTETARNTGRYPKYVISDNASIMRKGTDTAGMQHHSDITHSLGMLLERTYKKADDFRIFTEQVADVLSKCDMLPITCLLPPKQRTVAQFINKDMWVALASSMLDKMEQVLTGERSAFSFIPRNALLIDELSEVISCVRYIESVQKYEGLSPETA